MHISDGMLPAYAWAAGYAVAGLAVAVEARRVRDRDVPRLALLASTFFAASLIHVPIGPVSVHLALNGLVGLIAGPGAVMVIAAGLLLQALLFGHGGLTALGVNIVNIAVPAVLLGSLCRMWMASLPPARAALVAGVAGAAIPAASLMMVLGWSAVASDPAYAAGLRAFLLGSLPICLIEGVICAGTISYLLKVQPAVLGLARGAGRSDAVPVRAGS